MTSAKDDPGHLLKLVLERVGRDRPTEIRFVSGMAPALICATGPRFLKIAYLSTDVVYRLHRLCLSLADQSGILSRTSARYRAVVPGFGRFGCEYRLRDNTASLTLRPYSPDKADVSDAIKPVKRPPAPRAKAQPEEPPVPPASRPARRKPG